MNKKKFRISIAIAFFIIAVFHFSLNFYRMNKAPSNEWSKEAVISTGNILSNPSFIKYKDNFIVAHSDGDKIKILCVDKLGNKLEEKQFNANGAEPLTTNVVTDGNKLYLYWIVSDAGEKIIYSVTLDDKFNLLEEARIQGAKEIISIGENIIAISYKNNKIEITNMNTHKSYSVAGDASEFLSGASNKEGYVITFKQEDGEIKYFTLINGEISGSKTAAKLVNIRTNVYISSTLIADDEFGYLLMEYRSKGEFGGTNQIKFSLKEEGKYEISEFKVNDSKIEIADISPYYAEGAAKFLARIGGDIVEYNLTEGGRFVFLSNTRALSMYPSGKEDQAIFCDIVDRDKFNVCMTSKNDEFKKKYNNIRLPDAKYAFWDTLSGLMFSFAYIVPYGALWVIPSIGIIALYSIFEYKLPPLKKKIGFALIYLAYFILKSMGINFVSYKRFGRMMPEFMSFELSLVFSLAISLLCGIHAYKQYTDKLESNIGAINLTMPMIYDTILSLMVVVPFIV